MTNFEIDILLMAFLATNVAVYFAHWWQYAHIHEEIYFLRKELHKALNITDEDKE